MATTLRSDPIRFLHIVMIALQVFAVAQDFVGDLSRPRAVDEDAPDGSLADHPGLGGAQVEDVAVLDQENLGFWIASSEHTARHPGVL